MRARINACGVAYCPLYGSYLKVTPPDSGWYPRDLAHGFHLTREAQIYI